MIQSGQAHVVNLDAFSHPNVVTGRDIVPGAVTRETTALRISEWSRAQIDGEKIDSEQEWFRIPTALDGVTATRKDGTEIMPLVGEQWRKVTNPALSYMVLARFPGQAENQLINRTWVEAAMQRWQAWQITHGDRPPEDIRPIMGFDKRPGRGDLADTQRCAGTHRRDGDRRGRGARDDALVGESSERVSGRSTSGARRRRAHSGGR
jgi:hypothetical protein